MVGRRIGNYEFVSLAGAGGMGEVYRARDTKLKRDVAIKVLPEEFARDPERVSRFQREAQLLASLNHPNIAAIYGLEEEDAAGYLILEFVEGETLADRIRRGVIPVEEALKLALQITMALEAAHEKSVIHRDLKPANIKVTSDGKVKVLDFGLAKALSSGVEADLSDPATTMSAPTQHGVIMGTAGYMSPEQARGQTVDRRADVWAFGCVFFEMLTGRRTFEGKTTSDVLAAVLKTKPDWNRLPANLHPRVVYLLERCLEKEPLDRCQTMADARVEIRKALTEPEFTLLKPAPQPRVGLRFRIPWLVGTLIIAALVSILVWTLGRPEPARVVKLPLLLPEDQALQNSPVSMITVSRDGSRIIYAAKDYDVSSLFQQDLSETQPRIIPGTQDVSQPVLSPDGQWVAYTTGNPSVISYSLKKIPVSGGTPVTLMKESAAGLLDLSWTRNDTILLVAPDREILEIPAAGGTPKVLVKAESGEALGSPELLPDGKSLLFTSTTAPPGLHRWDAPRIFAQRLEPGGKGERHLVWEGGGDPSYVSTGHIVYAQGNTLFALRFDPKTLQASGVSTPIVEGIQRSSIGVSDTGKYAVSDTGTLVYVPGAVSDLSGYVLATMDGSGARRRLNVLAQQYRNTRLSPDGTQLAVETLEDDGRSRIWVYAMSGDSDIRPLTQNGSSAHPVWTPDSKSVTFASDREGTWKIYSQPINGGAAPVPLTTGEAGIRQLPESWAPDGRTLSFVKEKPGDHSLWTWSMDTRTSQLFLDTPGFHDFGSDFSPDGDWIAYATHDDKAPGIRVRRFPPTEESYQVTQDGEKWPVWRRNGLYFQTRSGGDLIWVDVSTKGTFRFGNRRTIPVLDTLTSQRLTSIRTRDYDIAPSGTEFVLIVPAVAPTQRTSAESIRQTRSQINVVLNWFRELRERVPTE